MKSIIVSIALIFLFLGTSLAQPSIKAEVDKKSVATDEAVVYKVTVILEQNNQPQIQLPKFDGFTIISTAESQTVSFADKTLKTHFLYVLVLVPRVAGTLKIPPVRLKSEAGTIESEAFEIQVKPGKKPVVPQEQPQVSL
jgi:hypothetical protein